MRSLSCGKRLSNSRTRGPSNSKSVEQHVATSGWYYREWKGDFYPDDLPFKDWFRHYTQRFNTVELNAPFYRWPTLPTVKTWNRQAPETFRYSIKVNRIITHQMHFQDTGKLIREFYQIADVLGPKMGCFLFQLPPSFHFTGVRLGAILEQLDSVYRNVVEFRHASWWRPEVFAAFQEQSLIFCSVSAPGLPQELVVTSDHIYVRFHGPRRLFYESYSDAELVSWSNKMAACNAREAWAYFNNTADGSAVPNALSLKQLMSSNFSPPSQHARV